MEAYLKKCASVFDIDILNYVDRQSGESGKYMAGLDVLPKKHTNKLLGDWLDNKNSDIDKVKSIVLRLLMKIATTIQFNISGRVLPRLQESIILLLSIHLRKMVANIL